MDRKGWTILILCSIGLVLNYKLGVDNSAKNRANQEKVEGATESGADDKSITASDNIAPNATTDASATPVAPEKEDQPYDLIAKRGDLEIARYTFTNVGGGIKQAEMLGENKVFEEGLVTLNERSETAIGALAKSYKDIEQTFYERIEQTKNSVKYQGQLEDGVTVIKSWTLENGNEDQAAKLKLVITIKTAAGKSFDLDDYSITTGSSVALFEKEQVNLSGWFYYEDGDYEHEESSNFSGGMFSDKKPVDSVETENLEYFGVDSQFFSTSFFPLADAKSNNLWAAGEKLSDGKRWRYNVGLELPKKSIGGDQTTSISYDVYVGPKLNKTMGSLSKNSDDIMNFSSLSAFAWISSKMNQALNGIQGWFASSPWSWGFAIVLLTIFIRIIIWPLHNKSTRTMKRMSKLQPIMKEMREKYKENPQKLNQETMKLYREYGVNPMGGCLPMLVQIPIFFGVFNMINAAVELRGQSFMWVKDLSQPDKIGEFMGLDINILPILMAVTMVLQMRMTPTTGDKLQRRIFMLMPLMFFFFCYNYAAALALYWTTQNIVSIGQTWLTHRMPEPELEKKVARSRKGGKGGAIDLEVDPEKPRKKGFMERMAEKMEQIHEEREAASGNAPVKKKTAPTTATKKAKRRTPKTGG